MSISVFCPFFDWVVYCFDIELHEQLEGWGGKEVRERGYMYKYS